MKPKTKAKRDVRLTWEEAVSLTGVLARAQGVIEAYEPTHPMIRLLQSGIDELRLRIAARK